MHDGAVFGQRGRLDDLVVPVDRERLRLLVDQDVEEVEQVLARRGSTPKPASRPGTLV